MAEGGPPSPEAQKKSLDEDLKASVKKGEIWYLVDNRWFKQWKKYVGYDSWDTYNVGDDNVHPGPIDNGPLLKPGSNVLKEHLVDDMDYALLSENAFQKIYSWYGLVDGQEPIKRKAIEQGTFVKHYKVEVYLMDLKLCENSDTSTHITHPFSRSDTVGDIEKEMRRLYVISDDKEVRLWNRYMSNTYEHLSNNDATLQDAGLYSGQVIVIEVKNTDGTWPRQAKSYTSSYTTSSYPSTRTAGFSGASASSSTFDSLGQSSSKSTYNDRFTGYYASNGYDRGSSHKPGLCGLANLGSTCFMNSALQCMSNVTRLTDYMLGTEWEKELNKDNPLGMRGEIAISYNELIRDIWSGTRSYTVPRNFKIAVGRFAPQFSGYQQQDTQELMAFLLDGLHEDLNRIRQKPYIELKDSGGRPDQEVAKEAWDNYKKRNDSIIVDTFHGLLKSTVLCPDCEKLSVTFDPFCYLSLPLPMKKERQMEVIWVPLPPEKKPIQLRLTVLKVGNIKDLCKSLSSVVNVPADRMIVTDVYNHRFHKMFNPDEGVNHILDRDDIFVYETTHSNIEDADEMIVPVYLRDKKYSVHHADQNSVSSQPLFGYPMLLAIPKQGCTYDKIYQLLLKRMSRYVHVPDNLNDWQDETADDEEDEEDSSGSGDSQLPESTSGDHQMELSSSNHSQDLSNNKLSSGTASSSSSKKKRVFSLRSANNFGRDEMGTIWADNDKPLHITNRTYIAVDWGKAAKDRFFNEKAAEDFEEHESMKSRPGQKRSAIQLDDCLKLFMKSEQLSEQDPWYCPDCKQHKQATKKFDLWSLPDVLIIHLKRFLYNRHWRDKLDMMVEFPVEGLDFQQFIINKETNECYVYDLMAVTNHYGGLGCGHYTAYAMHKDDKNWYYFDDSSVSSSSADSVNTKAAYVLVYQRRNLHNPKYGASPHISAETSSRPADNLETPKFSATIIPSGVGAASEEDDMETN